MTAIDEFVGASGGGCLTRRLNTSEPIAMVHLRSGLTSALGGKS